MTKYDAYKLASPEDEREARNRHYQAAEDFNDDGVEYVSDFGEGYPIVTMIDRQRNALLRLEVPEVESD